MFGPVLRGPRFKPNPLDLRNWDHAQGLLELLPPPLEMLKAFEVPAGIPEDEMSPRLPIPIRP